MALTRRESPYSQYWWISQGILSRKESLGGLLSITDKVVPGSGNT